MNDLIPRDRTELWKVLHNFAAYDTIEKVSALLKRPITEAEFNIWIDRINGSSDRMRQLWLHQSIPAKKGCCGSSE